MKRILVPVLALLLAVSLAACGDTQAAPEPAAGEPAAGAATEAATESATEAATEAAEPEADEPDDGAELQEGVDYRAYFDEENGVLFEYPIDFVPEGEPDEFGYMSFAEEGGTATMLYWAAENSYDEDVAAFMDRVFSFEPVDVGNGMVAGVGESGDQETGETYPAALVWLVEPDLIANVIIKCADQEEAAAWFDRLMAGEFFLTRDSGGGETGDALTGEGETPYWNGLDMGPNAAYAEEIASEADPGPFLNAPEAAKETFHAMKAGGHIPEYSDDTEYVMTLVEITDIEGEGCYVYRLDVDEPTGTVGAAYAYAYSSGTIYMQGQGGAWVIPEN